MSVTLDGQKIFDEEELEIELGSVRQDSVERAVPGLDGVLSIDLGKRSRKVKQSGVLRAKSQSQMNNRIAAISAFINGNTHKLVISGDGEFDNLRMDTFRVMDDRTSGNGVVIDYEIVYTQLVV
ncbi:MAG: hypothetical protein JSV99_02755 [Planctomycetota bacterium]|nr:MAG: hypothetical protein JSV99_02755 [Planctomycetota bacterium]